MTVIQNELMEMVNQVTEKGRCRRRKIGCLITDKDGNVIGEGFNGPPLSMASCFDEPCPDADLPAGHGPTAKCYGVHSETRALLSLQRPISEVHAIYSLKQPCTQCTLMLLETPCQEMYFLEKSNDETGLKLWERAGRKWIWMGDTITRRIDKVTDIIPSHRKTVIPAPKSVKLELTSRCNFSCNYCANRLKEKTQGEMDWNLYKRIVKEMGDAGVEELGMFYIGESFMCNWLDKAIEYAKKEIGIPYVFLTTNGSLANPHRVRKVMEAGLDSLKWSLNSADRHQFRQMTGCHPALFEQVIGNVKAAWTIRQEGYSTKLYASSIKYDGKQLDAMEELVKEIRPFVDEHYWLPLLSFGAKAADKEGEMGLSPVVGNPGRADNMRPPLPCWAVFREGHVTHEGHLSACCFDGSNQWVMADLNKTPFMDAWNSEKFQELRKAHLAKDVHNTPCETCIYGRNGNGR